MKIVKPGNVELAKNPHNVDVRKLYDHESAQVMHLTLQPGETLKPHITPVDVFFYVLEGTAEITVGDEKENVQANSLVESPKGIVHCIANTAKQVLRVLVVKAPRPTKATKVL